VKQDGRLALSVGSLPSKESDAVKQVLEDINRCLSAEESGEETEGMLSEELTSIGDKLIAWKEVQAKFHDKSSLPAKVLQLA
jgi:hypothetical protein